MAAREYNCVCVGAGELGGSYLFANGAISDLYEFGLVKKGIPRRGGST